MAVLVGERVWKETVKIDRDGESRWAGRETSSLAYAGVAFARDQRTAN